MSYFDDDWDLMKTLTNNGELDVERNENGTILIGHDPSVAPKAYRHIVYAPLEAEKEEEFVNRSTSVVSTCVLDFLRVANGMILNFGELRVLGYVPVRRQAKNTIHNYPPNIMVANDATNASGLFRVGYYKNRDTYAVLTRGGIVRLSNCESCAEPTYVWDDYKAWLVSESQRLAGC